MNGIFTSEIQVLHYIWHLVSHPFFVLSMLYTQHTVQWAVFHSESEGRPIRALRLTRPMEMS